MENQQQEDNQQMWQQFWTNASGLEKLGALLIGVAFFGDIFIGSYDDFEAWIFFAFILCGAGTAIGAMKKNKMLLGMGGFVILYLVIFGFVMAV